MLSLYIFQLHIYLVGSVSHQKYDNLSSGKFIELSPGDKSLSSINRHRRGVSEEALPDYVFEKVFYEGKRPTNTNQAFIKSNDNSLHLFFRKAESTETTKSSYWISHDFGKSWESGADKFGDVTIGVIELSKLDSKRLIFLESSASKRTQKSIFVSTDDMQTINEYQLPDGVVGSIIRLHPTQVDWMLLHDSVKRSLWISTDFGQNFRKISDNVTPDLFFWFESSIDFVPELPKEDSFGSIDNDRIVHFEHFLESEGRKVFEVVSCLIPNCDRLGGVYAELNDYSMTNDMAEGSLLISDGFIFFESRLNYASALHISSRRKPFEKARFPADVQQKYFHVVSSDQGFILLAINHVNEAIKLFVSDADGINFRVTLTDIQSFDKSSTSPIALKMFNADIHEAKGLRGCFLANQWFEGKCQTVITWNGGQTWTVLSKPLTQGEDGSWIPMRENDRFDTLNLQLENKFLSTGTYVKEAISKDNTPGFILASGYFGVSDVSYRSLFMTDDGGKTWRTSNLNAPKVSSDQQFSHDFLDYGSILVVIPRTTQDLYYSTTGGENWDTFKFSSEPVTTDAIWTKDNDGEEMTVFAHNSDENWVTVTINMTHLRDYCGDDDYELWKYSDCDQNNIIGSNQAFWRKKTTSDCYNPPKFAEDKVSKSYDRPCKTCTMDDYFCQKDLKVTEDKRCSYRDVSNGWAPKSALVPIKAPGNRCKEPFPWAADQSDCQLASVNIGGTLSAFPWPGDIHVEILDSCGSEFTWNLYSGKGQKLEFEKTTKVAELEIKSLSIGNYTIQISDGHVTAVENFRVLQKISKAYLSCPIYTRVGYPNELSVNLADKYGNWLNSQALPQMSGPISYNWHGLPQFNTKNQAALNVTFDNTFYAEVQIDVFVDVESTLGSVKASCRMKAISGLEVIEVNFSSNLLSPTHSEQVMIMKEHLTAVFLEDYKSGLHDICNKYKFDIDKGLDVFPVYGKGNVTRFYVYLLPTENFIGEMVDFRDELLESILTVHKDETPTLNVVALYVVENDGTLSPYTTPVKGRAIFGYLTLFLILLASSIYGRRHIVKRFKDCVRRTHVPVSGSDNDEEPIIGHDELGNEIANPSRN